ncbi:MULTISPECIES: ferritin-like domain-containing protein [Hymenobacter]|uniref:Ferritin-like domain-containing protein n=1 Tax=Hymenobacter jejuensis TaxID=2502781 RepID=A0A5B8A2D2_9BACT|nr:MULTISPECIES: ferritin-like domain-containing protein [Hymenobacter]MBC6990752.1 ferritin-like domain-containing protein [Hymenobacter sp. BT491]QDA60845.1 ferritin-like domain-containing protein [Hymenobacter jejuensis]
MNIFAILSELEKTDPEVFERFDSRRRVFKHMTGFGKTLAASALPLALGSIFNKAYGQTTSAPSVNDVLNFALKLEYLESYFYDAGLGVAGSTATAAQTTFRALFSATNLSALDKIRTDEANHVKYLATALGANAIAAPARTQFDFTGGKGSGTGPFADVFLNPATFLAVAQSLEDTGVRAYKGGAPYLMSNKDVLTAALNIHSVEARHASRLRTMRRAGANNNTASAVAPAGTTEAGRNASPKSWISGKDNGGASPTQTAPIYDAGTAPSYTPTGITFPAEDNVTQGGVNLQTALSSLNFPTLAFSEAFDEPLPVPTVSAIASTFTITGSTLFS